MREQKVRERELTTLTLQQVEGKRIEQPPHGFIRTAAGTYEHKAGVVLSVYQVGTGTRETD